MTSFLRLVLLAGPGHGDRFAELLGGAKIQNNANSDLQSAEILAGGLGELLHQFREAGHGEIAESWVKNDTNQPITEQELQQAIGTECLRILSHQTGMSQQEILSVFAHNLPEVVDQYTPQGRIPVASEVD
jgi:uncharacterized protein YidB (DUF937 family)